MSRKKSHQEETQSLRYGKKFFDDLVCKENYFDSLQGHKRTQHHWFPWKGTTINTWKIHLIYWNTYVYTRDILSPADNTTKMLNWIWLWDEQTKVDMQKKTNQPTKSSRNYGTKPRLAIFYDRICIFAEDGTYFCLLQLYKGQLCSIWSVSIYVVTIGTDYKNMKFIFIVPGGK